MKIHQRYLKRIFAVFCVSALALTLLAVIPVSAEAAAQPSYNCRFTLQIKNLGSGRENNYVEIRTVTQRSNVPNTTYTFRDITVEEGTVVFCASLPGIPKEIVSHYESRPNVAARWYVTAVEVQNIRTGAWMPLWQGEFGVKTKTAVFQKKTATATMILPPSSNDACPAFIFADDVDNKYDYTDFVVKSVLPAVENGNFLNPSEYYVDVPAGTGVNTLVLQNDDLYDQYGALWYQQVEYSMSSRPGFTLSKYTLNVTAEANAANDYTFTFTRRYAPINVTNTVHVRVFRYTVRFLNFDGSLFYEANNLPYGASAAAPGTPTKPSDDYQHYTFSGWAGAAAGNLSGADPVRAMYAQYAAQPHNWGDEIVLQASTCVLEGTGMRTCADCGYEKHYPIPVTAHTPAPVSGYAPTCTEAGLTDGTVCAECGEPLAAQTPIPPTGHTPTAVPGYAPTCTEAGLTDGTVCSACGAPLTAQTQIPPRGHTDADNDGLCDDCGTRVRPQTLIERLRETIQRLLNIIRRLFGL